MAKKNYYGGATPVAKSKTAEVAAMLHKAADMLPNDYQGHAKAIRTKANELLKSHGQPRYYKVVEKADPKGSPID